MPLAGRSIGRIWSVVFAVAVLAVPDADRSVDDFVRHALRFSDKDLRTVGRGGPAAKSLDSHDSHDVAAAGLIRLNATPRFFVDSVRDITRFKSGDAVLQIGTFSSTPSFDDVQRLTWDADDLRAFRRCRIGDCDLRLTAETMQRFRTEVEWSSSQHDQQASHLANQVLVEMAAAY
ncbi:MAG: hypothetical protein ABI988_19655, partial [Nitrospirota bacterium]